MIIYFSGNGNTKWCAQNLASATGDRIASIADMTIQGDYDIQLTPDERLGIFFPVHGWKPPRIVLDFISRMHVTPSPSYCYSVCTCGDSIGEAMSQLDNTLLSQGITLSSAFSIVMPETYVCLPFMYTDTLDNEQRKIANASNILKGISSLVNQRATNRFDLKKGPLPWFFTHIVGSFFNRFMITDRPFHVDADKCTHCGKCAKVCPVRNISYDSHALPEWQKSNLCTCCMACYHHCPHHAIDYGTITRHRSQYYFGKHPLVVKKQ